MTTDTRQTSTADTLRLENCPRCEYLLHGLPEEGICPECGWAYDRCAVIVRCRCWGMQFNSYVIGAVSIISLAGVVLVLMVWPGIAKSMAQLIFGLVFIVMISAITLIDRATSPRVGDWLLWVTPAGIGVQQDFDPDSLLAQFRRAIVAVFMPVCVMSGFIPATFRAGSFWYIGVIMAAVFGIGYFWLLRAIKPKPAIPAQGARPGLFAWNDIDKIEITGPKRGRYRLTAWRSSWISKRQPLILVTLAGSDEMIGQFRQRIDLWYRSPNHGN